MILKWYRYDLNAAILVGIIMLLSTLEKIILTERRKKKNIINGPASTSKTTRGINPLNSK